MEEALEQVRVLDLVLQLVEDRDLAVHEGLKPPREIDEDLDLLFAARLAGELGRLHDGGDGAVVRAGEVGGEQLELVGVRLGPLARLGRGRALAPAQALDDGAQVGLGTGAATAQGADAFPHGRGGPVGADGGDQDAREGHAPAAGEHRPQDDAGACAGGADGEQHGRNAAERHRDRRQDRQPQQLGP